MSVAVPAAILVNALVISMASATTTSSAGWSSATTLAGSLNLGGDAQVTSVACAPSGRCVAGGYYTDATRHQHAFVVDEFNGQWSTPTTLLGSALAGGEAQVSAVACDATHCVAGGYYRDGSGHLQAFVAEEYNGSWSAPTTLVSAVNTGGYAQVNAVACDGSGYCVAGGYYTDATTDEHAFVVDEVNGQWSSPVDLSAGLHQGQGASVTALTCEASGHCVAGALYTDAQNRIQPFVSDEFDGHWSSATPLAVGLSVGTNGEVASVACDGSGHCVAGGMYAEAAFSTYQAFVSDEVSGHWSNGTTVGQALNVGEDAAVRSVSCTAAAYCLGGGWYFPTSSSEGAFTVEEINGQWRPASALGAVPNAGTPFFVGSVACVGSNYCVAGGTSGTSSSGTEYPFVADQVNGRWVRETALVTESAPFTNAGTNAVACAPTGFCVAGGSYADASNHSQAFVSSEQVPVATLSGLVVSRTGTTVTATWRGTAGATYTCTLLYGYGVSSGFSKTTRSPSCSFDGLKRSMSFGVRVGPGRGGSTDSLSAFVAGERVITCVRGRHHRRVYGLDPRCPARWHRRR